MSTALEYVYTDIDGMRFGAWYRLISSDQIEVMGVGLLQVVRCLGSTPAAAACSTLQNFVRRRKLARLPVAGAVPSLSSDAQEMPANSHHCDASSRRVAVN